MQRRTMIACRLGSWLCILLVLSGLVLPAFAEGEADVFVAPRISKDAPPYDPEHPENLQEDQLAAKAAILIEEDSGEAIFSKNPDDRMFPASTTKILTVFLGLTIGQSNGIMDEMVTVSDEDFDFPEGYSTIPLEAGETIRFEDLLYATMVRSGNEGANTIARAISGSIPDFVELMNQTAQMMGCTSTHFSNANGKKDEQHYTTARDMAIIAQTAMENSDFRKIAATTSYDLPKSEVHKARTVRNNTNPMLVQSENNSYYYPYATGIKTGFHNLAGYCFVGSATKNGVSLISVVFYSGDTGRWEDTKRLMEYGFSQYVSVTPVELYDMNPITLETTGFSTDDPDLGRLPLYLVPMDDTATASIVGTRTQVENMSRNLQDTVIIEYIRDFAAPITAGEQMGTMTYFPPNGSDPVEYALIASRTINQREDAPKSIQQIINETYADPNPFPRISVEMVVVTLLPFVGLYFVIRALRRAFGKIPGRRGSLPKPTSRRYR